MIVMHTDSDDTALRNVMRTVMHTAVRILRCILRCMYTVIPNPGRQIRTERGPRPGLEKPSQTRTQAQENRTEPEPRPYPAPRTDPIPNHADRIRTRGLLQLNSRQVMRHQTKRANAALATQKSDAMQDGQLRAALDALLSMHILLSRN